MKTKYLTIKMLSTELSNCLNYKDVEGLLNDIDAGKYEAAKEALEALKDKVNISKLVTRYG